MSDFEQKFRAVVFDLDGTLADSLSGIAGALNQALAARGFPTHSLDAYRQMIGEGVEHLVQSALPSQAHGILREVIAEYRAHYAHTMTHTTQPYPGIVSMLQRLKALRIKMSVLSNKRDDFTVALVEQLFADVGFVEVRGEREGVPRKPDPTAALELAASMQEKPENCLFVGDTRIDMLTAQAAGMWPVGVLWGFRSEDELRGHGAQLLLRHPEELLSVWKSR